tara:strand:- start:2433 stop:3008 length:576 start_codon:yes stop_codon:yes gene_type:complete
MTDRTVIHPTAEIAEGASIGAGTRVWQHCILMSGATVGRDCKLAHNVFVETGARVGDHVTIKDNVVLYDGVVVEDDAFIGPNAVFTNVSTPRAFISRKDAFEKTRIGKGASIGANATIVCGHAIGTYALVGSGSVITRDVPDYALVVGNPARQIGWVSRTGCRMEKDLVCPETGERYFKCETGLMAVSDDT